MPYQEKFFRVVEHKRLGLFWLRHRWTYVLIDAHGDERRLDRRELLAALLSPRKTTNQDAYRCMHRASELFRNGQSEWVGYPSGAVVADLNRI
jgi:hypothetical protein